MNRPLPALTTLRDELMTTSLRDDVTLTEARLAEIEAACVDAGDTLFVSVDELRELLRIAKSARQELPARLARHAALLILDELSRGGLDDAGQPIGVDALAARPDAAASLARAVEDQLSTPAWSALFASALGFDVIANMGQVEHHGDDVDGVFPLDEQLAVLLSTTGEMGGRLANEKVRSGSRTRSRDENAARWGPDAEPSRVPRLLARALWHDVVRPRLAKLADTHAALARVVHIDVLSMLRPGQTYENGFIVDEDGRQRMMFTRTQALDVPAVEMGAIPRLLSRGVEMLGSIQAHRTVRHLVVEGHRQAITGEADPRVLRYPGGWSAFADAAGVNHADDARAIVVALAHAEHALADGTHGNLLTWSARRGGPGRPGLVSLTLGDMLLPHFVHSIDQSKGRTATENRQLVPVVELPALVGRSNEHGAQAAFQMTLIARFRSAAAELATTGAVRITDAELAELAERAGLSPARLPRVLEAWTKDDKVPAFLVRQGDRFTLAPHYAPALAFLVAAGRMSAARSKAGKASRAVRGVPRRTKKKPPAPAL